MLVAMGGKGGTIKRNGENGHHAAEVETKTNGFSSTYSSNDLSSSLSNNKFSSSTSKLNSEIKQSSLFQQSKKESNLSSTTSSNKFESNNFSSSLKTNGTDDLKKKAVSDYEKTEVSNFSSLNTPSLLLGGSSNTKSSGLEESRNTFSSSTEQLNSGRATYSTTIERSINTGASYSSLNKPHEARIKGLNNGGSSTMPKSLSSKGVERKASLHAEPLSKEASNGRTNGTNGTLSSTYSAVKSSSGYAATSSLSPPKPAPAPPSPKLPSYKGTADKCKFVGDTVRHFNAGKPATFEMFAPGAKKSDVEVNIISPEKRHIPHKVVDSGNGVFRIEFTTVEVGSYVIDVTVSSLSVPSSPLIAKAYDATLIKVTDISDGVVGDLSTFRVDASKAGEGQLEISINDGDVPNAVQVLGGGKCLVTFTPEQAITHEIEVMFNNDQVPGSPFLCRVLEDNDDISYGGSSSGGFSHVIVELEHLALVPISQPAEFTIRVPEGADAELAVSVQGPVEDIPVKVTGNVKNGFVAQFIPNAVGLHVVLVEYNGVAG